jgi:hypothetical protein
MISIDDQCSKFFTYRDLIECSDTWKNNKKLIDNIPKEKDTFLGMQLLCKTILDPVEENFGKIILTYGFASKQLTKFINKNIYPKLDQHSGYEKDKKGNYLCSRLGQSVDFYILKKNSKNIAQWIINNILFDRLYFYGDERPIHVSVGPDNKKQIVKMLKINNKLIPKVVVDLN